MNTTSAVSIFNFKTKEVRTVIKDGEVWFVAGDIAKALNYPAAKDMTRFLDDDEKGAHIVPTLGGNQTVTTINESGLYHSLFKSRKLEAEVFRKWVTSEVLPSIRKTGAYKPAPGKISEEQYSLIKSMFDTRYPDRMDRDKAVRTFCKSMKITSLEDINKDNYYQCLASLQKEHELINSMCGCMYLTVMSRTRNGNIVPHMTPIDTDMVLIEQDKYADPIKNGTIPNQYLAGIVKACADRLSKADIRFGF